MAPARGAAVKASKTFEADRKALAEKYPDLEHVLTELADLLMLGYDLPEIPVDRETDPRVYAIRLDYPPMGSAGRGAFLVTYHATDPKPNLSMTEPYRVFTLLTITERPSHRD